MLGRNCSGPSMCTVHGATARRAAAKLWGGSPLGGFQGGGGGGPISHDRHNRGVSGSCVDKKLPSFNSNSIIKSLSLVNMPQAERAYYSSVDWTVQYSFHATILQVPPQPDHEIVRRQCANTRCDLTRNTRFAKIISPQPFIDAHDL